jgi:hypothetical protein
MGPSPSGEGYFTYLSSPRFSGLRVTHTTLPDPFGGSWRYVCVISVSSLLTGNKPEMYLTRVMLWTYPSLQGYC